MAESYQVINPSSLLKESSSALLVDVRSPAEYNEKHLANSLNLPLGDLSEELVLAKCGNNKSQAIILVCASGMRSKQAAEKLVSFGFSNISNIEGGLNACKDPNLQIIKGSGKVMSLERQVRVAAGGLVLLGIVFSCFINESFIFLSAFVGAGLVFSGLTDTCGMALILAKMPWNYQKSCSNNNCCK